MWKGEVRMGICFPKYAEVPEYVVKWSGNKRGGFGWEESNDRPLCDDSVGDDTQSERTCFGESQIIGIENWVVLTGHSIF